MTTDPQTRFEALYREYARQITNFIASRLYRADTHLAEDLTAETFLGLWRTLDAGTRVEHPRALLHTIAERAISGHFRRHSAWESATDFGVTNATEVASGAAGTPHLAGLFAELEQAKDALTVTAEEYKAVSARLRQACGTLASASRPESVARSEARKAVLVEERDQALGRFVEAGRAVALARAAWNADAGHLHGLLSTSELKAAGR